MLSKETPIYSSFGDDPDMLELIEEFVANLSDRVQSLEAAASADELSEITRMAHQLKGASGGYGFDIIGQAAAALEQTSEAVDSAAQVQQEVSELISLCQRATAEKPA